jgi:hypothetical protein
MADIELQIRVEFLCNTSSRNFHCEKNYWKYCNKYPRFLIKYLLHLKVFNDTEFSVKFLEEPFIHILMKIPFIGTYLLLVGRQK